MTERPGETAGPTGTAPASVHASRNHASSHAHKQHTHAPDGSCCAGHDHNHGHAETSRPIDPTALISVRGLKIVRSGRTILADIDLDIHSREILTLIGPNGAGKTTLVRALLGLERPDDGIVARRPGLSIGYVPQRFDIDRTLPMTVERFLTLGDGGARWMKWAPPA
jgi:zinc transport system ATP-binding protein